MGSLYILRDSNGRLYIGSTTNIERRIYQHRHGHTSTTKRMSNPELVFLQEYPDINTARKVERRLKKLKRKDYIEKIIKEGFVRSMGE